MNYANRLRKIRRYYADTFTQSLRNYLNFTQLYYADITQKSRKTNHANLRILRNHDANKLFRNTQINYKNHYADYAMITKFNYAASASLCGNLPRRC